MVRKILLGIVNKLLKRNIYWHHPAMFFCLITSSKLSHQQFEFSLKVKVRDWIQAIFLNHFYCKFRTVGSGKVWGLYQILIWIVANPSNSKASSLNHIHKKPGFVDLPTHTPYSRIIMWQKWEGDCGLWVLIEIVLRKYAESLKKIVGAVWELPAK